MNAFAPAVFAHIFLFTEFPFYISNMPLIILLDVSYLLMYHLTSLYQRNVSSMRACIFVRLVTVLPRTVPGKW